VNICYSFDPATQQFNVESCDGTTIPGFPFSVPFKPSFKPWIPELPPQFVPPGAPTPPTPPTPGQSSNISTAPASASLQSLVEQVRILMEQVNAMVRVRR
jgi:hypothetical protein